MLIVSKKQNSCTTTLLMSRDEWLELRALDTPERIETFIVKGEEFEGYARYDETYTVEIVGIADRQGGEEQFYMIDVSHR